MAPYKRGFNHIKFIMIIKSEISKELTTIIDAFTNSFQEKWQEIPISWSNIPKLDKFSKVPNQFPNTLIAHIIEIKI